jgi:hypothetical protein
VHTSIAAYLKGVSLLTDGLLARLFWRVVDALDYCLTQAVLWLADAVAGPDSESDADRWRECDRGSRF